MNAGRYWVFSFNDYEADGGLDSLRFSTDDLEAAKMEADKLIGRREDPAAVGYDEVQIADVVDGKMMMKRNMRHAYMGEEMRAYSWSDWEDL